MRDPILGFRGLWRSVSHVNGDFGGDRNHFDSRASVAAIRREIDRQELTHDNVAKLAGVARANVTGIISRSVTSVNLDRMMRIAAALEL